MILGEGKRLEWNGKKIGFFTENDKGSVLVMPRKAEHRFRMYDSWGINTEVLGELASTPGIVEMRIIVDEGKKILITTPEKWQRKGFPYRAHRYEPQTMLRETDFDKVVGWMDSKTASE